MDSAQGSSGVHPPGIPQPVEAVVASIEAIIQQTKYITKVPEINVVEAGQADNTPVRQYCLSYFKNTWTSKVSPFATVLKQFLSVLESTKPHSAKDFIGSRQALTRNCLRLKDLCDQQYGKFIAEIMAMDESMFKAPTGSTLNAAQASKDAKKRADYWAWVQVELSEKLEALDTKMDDVTNQFYAFHHKN